MKIAYIVNHDISSNDGVTKKLKSQTSAWNSANNTVDVYALVRRGGDSILNAKQYLKRSPVAERLVLNKTLLDELKSFNPDLVYFRYDTWSRTLSKILKQYPCVVELNTLDLGEFWNLLKKEKTIKSFLRYFAYRLLRDQVLTKVSGIVAVTREIAEHQSNKKFKKPTTWIPNGIDLKRFSTIKRLNVQNDRIGIFFIGTPNQPWHGVDVLLDLSIDLPDYDFHIVGITGTSKNNVYFHGYLSQEKYSEILKKCHLCIGSLALYRNDMTEACPLKVREYLAYGYPTIIGFNDTAFLDNTPDYIFKITRTNIDEKDFSSLCKFIERNKTRIVLPSELGRIDSNILENQRLSFFRKFT